MSIREFGCGCVWAPVCVGLWVCVGSMVVWRDGAQREHENHCSERGGASGNVVVVRDLYVKLGRVCMQVCK